MDIYTIDRFCARWIQKANVYQDDAIESLFDRFFTLFVAFNSFYSASAGFHRSTLEPRQAKLLLGDRQEATTIMERLIGQSRFSKAADENDAIAAACLAISRLLQNHLFFLHSIRGTDEPDLVRDATLANGLQSHSLMAVLECLYQIRCNIFHGKKEFAPRQAELLAPANILLETIVELSGDAMHEAALRCSQPRSSASQAVE